MQDRRKEFIKKAEKYKPILHTEVVRPIGQLPTKALKAGEQVVFDFGNHYVGKLTFRCSFKGSHPDAPAFLKMKFCEVERELHEDSADYQGWISKSWIQEEWMHVDVIPSTVSMPRRYAMRFVKIEILDISSKYDLVFEDIFFEACTAADDSMVSVFHGNEQEEKLDRIAVRTLRNCMQDVFEDGPKRDRRLWIGDLRLQALTNYATYRNLDVFKRCMYLFAGTTDEKGRVRACLFTEPEVVGDDTYMFDYSLFFIPLLLDYYEETKDCVFVEELLDTAKRQLELAKEYFDEKHVIKNRKELGWCFIDWNLNLNKQAGAQAIYIYCEKAMITLLTMLGKEEEAQLLQCDVMDKEQAAKQYLYDEQKGLFVSGKEKQISYASQVWAVLAGILSKEENEALLQRIHKQEEIEAMVTPYMYHNYVEALLQCDMREEAYDVMMSYWGGMEQDGADTFYELFNPQNPMESPYGSSIVNSYCHAWSCTPSYFMRKHGLVRNRQEQRKGFIFDLDGVLVFTDHFHYLAWKQIADKLDIPFDESVNNRLRGVSRMDSLEIILEKYKGTLTQEEKIALAEEKNEVYRQFLCSMTREDVSEEVCSTLQTLHDKGYLIALGSSSKNAKFILDKTELTPYFDAISDGTNITKSKPDPEVFLKAAQYLGLPPQQCIVVEDAYSGIDAAKAGGMKAVGIGDAASYKKADQMIARFEDLMMIE